MELSETRKCQNMQELLDDKLQNAFELLSSQNELLSAINSKEKPLYVEDFIPFNLSLPKIRISELSSTLVYVLSVRKITWQTKKKKKELVIKNF